MALEKIDVEPKETELDSNKLINPSNGLDSNNQLTTSFNIREALSGHNDISKKILKEHDKKLIKTISVPSKFTCEFRQSQHR